MVIASSEANPYLTRFSNGKQTTYADTTPDKGGGDLGFRPHELLEAALATCMNMHIRMYAASKGIEPGEVCTTVTLDRNSPSEAVFNYSIELSGQLDDEQRNKLLEIAESCPVHRTLSKRFSFRSL
ncbi:MAG TPA: OsmC family protein [Spirochaetia bacterium]|nr:OsmC family protein [Spirochaetia bacterium]